MVESGLNLAPNYQLVLNPAYNADRGLVNTFGLHTRSEGRHEPRSFL